MHIPEWFSEELERQSGGKYRVRWSPARNRFQVEEKIGRQTPRKKRFANHDDEAIKETDGYRLLCEITPGDQSRCPRCQRYFKVRKQSVGTSKCQHCGKEWKFFFMSLGSDLLLHLRYIQPELGGHERVLADVDRDNELREQGKARDRHNNTEAIWKEDFGKIFEIQSTGWTGSSGKRIGSRTWS